VNFSSIQPIVLVGGRSSRFGRDKLRVPLAGGWLVDLPITALREVFGSRVAAVGDCDPTVAARADLHIRDRYPGAGPLGGIAAAIETSGLDVFVLPGDASAVSPALVRDILAVSDNPALAIIAQTTRPEPCIGLYRIASLSHLRQQLAGSRSLHDAIPPARLRLVQIDPRLAANINTPGDLAAPGSP